jgi:hypothetical protein
MPPRFLRKKLPRYPIPVALIGRLAVDERACGRRLGERLLKRQPTVAAVAQSMLGTHGRMVHWAGADGRTAVYAAVYGLVSSRDEIGPVRR